MIERPAPVLMITSVEPEALPGQKDASGRPLFRLQMPRISLAVKAGDLVSFPNGSEAVVFAVSPAEESISLRHFSGPEIGEWAVPLVSLVPTPRLRLAGGLAQ